MCQCAHHGMECGVCQMMHSYDEVNTRQATSFRPHSEHSADKLVLALSIVGWTTFCPSAAKRALTLYVSSLFQWCWQIWQLQPYPDSELLCRADNQTNYQMHCLTAVMGDWMICLLLDSNKPHGIHQHNILQPHSLRMCLC